MCLWCGFVIPAQIGSIQLCISRAQAHCEQEATPSEGLEQAFKGDDLSLPEEGQHWHVAMYEKSISERRNSIS